MIIHDSKKTAGLILAGLDPSKGEMHMPEPEKMDNEDDSHEGLRAAAEELMEAIHNKDVHGLAVALQSFIELSEGEDDKDDEEENSAEPDDRQKDE